MKYVVDLGNVEIDVGKYDLVFRKILSGEQHVSVSGRIETFWGNQPLDKRIVLVPKWQAPSFLKPGWVARHYYGLWFWCEKEPTIIENKSWSEGKQEFALNHIKWTPPHGEDVPWYETKTKVH